MEFFIKQNSTKPILEYPVGKYLLDKYDLTKEMFETCAVTFSMIDADTKRFKIANTSGLCIFKDDKEENFYEGADVFLTFEFCQFHTKDCGKYYGEFKVDFLQGSGGKITFPVDNCIDIYIQPSITKTTIVTS